MARVADHLSVAELEDRYRACADATEARHLQAIWLLAKGHGIAAVAATVAFGERWVERLLARYNDRGVAALGDLRRQNGTRARVLVPALLARLRLRLGTPPPDGGLWTSGKVASWMAGELGLEKVAAQRGWEALKAVGFSIQSPRPKDPASAGPEEREVFKKSSGKSSSRRPCGTRSGRLRSSPPTSIASA
jgi:transposase